MKNIPKIAHFYWGNSILPYMRYLTLYSFKKYNPDWKINFYTPIVLQSAMSWNSSEHKFPINCTDYSGRLASLGIQIIPFDFKTISVSNSFSEVLKSDFLRWHLLSTQGGLWADMDILFFRPINQIAMNEKVDTVLCFQRNIWSVGFLMSSAENLVFKRLNNTAHNYFNPITYQSIGRVLLERNFTNIQDVNTKFPAVCVHNLPMDIVYPVNSVKINQVYVTTKNRSIARSLIKPTSIGLHWYAGKQKLGHWINEINASTYKNYNNVICNLIRKVVT